jgi:hypothetical protein
MSNLHLTPTVLFWVMALGLLLLPFLPSLKEWLAPTDVLPLPMAPGPQGLGREQATAFEAWLQTEARPGWQAGDSRADNRQTLPFAGHACRILHEPEAWWRQQRGKAIHEGLLASSELIVPDDAVCPWEVASMGALKLGRRVQVGAAFGADLTVGHDARIFQWARASKTLRVLTGAHLDGDCSAGQQLLLADDVRFARLHAPAIKVSSQSEAQAPATHGPQALPLFKAKPWTKLAKLGATPVN